MKTTLALLIATILAAVAQGAEPEAKPDDLPTGLSFVEEMQSIPEVDSWERYKPGTYSGAVEAARKAWPAEAKRISKHVTPEVARRLSRWAKTQMAGYSKLPPLEKVRLEPISYHAEQKFLVLKGTVDTLPVHSPVVTRWLQVYVLCDSAGGIQRVTVTIRGEVRE